MMDNKNIAVMTSSESNDWETPQEFVDSLPFDFDIDVCATLNNTKCQHFIPPETNALSDYIPGGWGGLFKKKPVACFMNPPYGRSVGDWIERAYQESKEGCVVVCLIPNRTETKWFSRIWLDASLICFVGRRIKFLHPDRNKQKNGAPFANVIAVFGDPSGEWSNPGEKIAFENKGDHTEVDMTKDYEAFQRHKRVMEDIATELAKIGTVILPGYGNIWLHREGGGLR